MHQPAPRNEVVSSVFSDAGDVSQIQSSIPSPTVRSRSATFTGTTEQRENYTWPDSTTAAKSTPVLNSNKSKLMFGVNPPKVRSVWKENDRRKLMGAFANPVNAKKMSLTQTRFPSSTGSPYFHSNVYRNRGASPAHRFGTSYAANRGVNKNLVDARNHRGSRPNSAKDSSTRSEQEKPTTDTAFSADSLAVVPVANGTTTTITDVDAASNFDTITTPATGKNTNYSKQYGDQYSVGSNSLNDSYAQSAGTG